MEGEYVVLSIDAFDDDHNAVSVRYPLIRRWHKRALHGFPEKWQRDEVRWHEVKASLLFNDIKADNLTLIPNGRVSRHLELASKMGQSAQRYVIGRGLSAKGSGHERRTTPISQHYSPSVKNLAFPLAL